MPNVSQIALRIRPPINCSWGGEGTLYSIDDRQYWTYGFSRAWVPWDNLPSGARHVIHQLFQRDKGLITAAALQGNYFAQKTLQFFHKGGHLT